MLSKPPIGFIYTLPAAKDAQAVLDHLSQTPVNERLGSLLGLPNYRVLNPERAAIIEAIIATGAYTDSDLKQLHSLQENISSRQTRKQSEQFAGWLSRSAEFGKHLLSALQNYFDVFFKEEEQRLQPHLEGALDKARLLAEEHTVKQLIEELSGGVTYSDERMIPFKTIVLAPSFWLSPFIGRSDLTPTLGVYLFGARPDKASLVPGEVVPDALYRALKALADPTRLKIMKYLAEMPQTPTELANKLRLRPPTVIHHLHTLRLAQLVYVSISAEGRRYAARTEAIDSAMQVLSEFLQPDTVESFVEVER